jgi:hypothetical protein
MTTLDALLLLIDARIAALRAARSPDYAAYRADYERRAADYALCIEVIGRRFLS